MILDFHLALRTSTVALVGRSRIFGSGTAPLTAKAEERWIAATWETLLKRLQQSLLIDSTWL